MSMTRAVRRWSVLGAVAGCLGLARADGADPLAAWKKAVAAADTGKAPLSVVLLGDSNTEIFGYAGCVRLLLQSGYGSRGLGYYTLGKRMEELPGTNDMCNGWDEKGYGAQMRILLAKLRQAAPGASVLVISAPSCTFDRKALSAEFDAAVREAATAQGCAFWSLHDLVGTDWRWWNQLEMMEYTLHYLPAGGMRVALELLRNLGLDVYAPEHQPAVKQPAQLLRDGAKPVERSR